MMKKVENRLSQLSRQLQLSPMLHQLEQLQVEEQPVCGIVAYVSTAPPSGECFSFLQNGLKILENRGYDSAGIATLDSNNRIRITKFASTSSPTNKNAGDAIDRLKNFASEHSDAHIGIGHTRWATHGGRTDVNAHPHVDQSGTVAVIHNGVITNSEEIRRDLQSKNIKFQSETDTECIAQLLGRLVNQGKTPLEAIKEMQGMLNGTWGCVALFSCDPERLYGFKNGSPLLIGVGRGKMFLASEPAAFGQFTKDFISLNDDEVAVVSSSTHSLDTARIEKAHYEEIKLDPSPFPHWTLKETMEQPESISKAMNYGGRFFDSASVKLGGLDSHLNELSNVDHLIISACGTSLHAGLVAALIMRWLQSFKSVQVVDAAEIKPDLFRVDSPERVALLVISQSGETKDVHRALVMASDLGITVFSVVNVVGSLIARQAKCGVYLNAGREMAVASTKAFTSQVTVLCLIAIWFAQIHNLAIQHRTALMEALHRLPITVGSTLRLRDQTQQIARDILRSGKHNMFVLGKGIGEAIAKEGALKIKEIGYLHAEAYSGGALKHGPFALIEDETPIILIILDDEHGPFMKICAEEVRSRGARTIVISNDPHTKQVADELILIPTNGILTNLVAVIPLQLLAYELSVLQGINPDKPRHLAKAVTVD